jgi:hypothetical protein
MVIKRSVFGPHRKTRYREGFDVTSIMVYEENNGRRFGKLAADIAATEIYDVGCLVEEPMGQLFRGFSTAPHLTIIPLLNWIGKFGFGVRCAVKYVAVFVVKSYASRRSCSRK